MPWPTVHIDLSMPHPAVWNYLRGFVDQYDAAIFSLPEYAQDLEIVQRFVTPAINPFRPRTPNCPSAKSTNACLSTGSRPIGRW